MSSARPSRLPLLAGLAGVLVTLIVCGAFIVGLLRAQDRERAAPPMASTIVGHWTVDVAGEPSGSFTVTLRHGATSPPALPVVTLGMAGMPSTVLAVRPLMNGAYGANGKLPMSGDWRLIVEDGDSTAEIPLPSDR